MIYSRQEWPMSFRWPLATFGSYVAKADGELKLLELFWERELGGR